MPDIKHQIENTLVKDLPWTITCPHCERDIDWDFDLAQVLNDLEKIIKPDNPNRHYYQDGYLLVDPGQFLVMVQGKRLRLTAIEHRLLACLVANRGRVLTHRQILTSVWGWEYMDDVDYLRIYVCRVRQKIERDPSHPEYIINENGIGYYFNDQANNNKMKGGKNNGTVNLEGEH